MISNFICVCHVNDINLTQILLGSTGKTKHAHETKRPKEDGHKPGSQQDQPETTPHGRLAPNLHSKSLNPKRNKRGVSKRNHGFGNVTHITCLRKIQFKGRINYFKFLTLTHCLEKLQQNFISKDRRIMP